MDVKKAIKERRAYRSLAPVEINRELIEDLAESASLAPSCFNKQPWRYVFVHAESKLSELHEVLAKGNEWAESASMIIAVLAKAEDDCVLSGREYYLFDVGLATSMLILRATELGLVAHPIAGYDEAATKEVLNIPDDYTVITLINVGKKAEEISGILSDKQVADEKTRPDRKKLSGFVYENNFNK